MTQVDDARAAADAGADAIGLVFHRPSPRHLNLDRAHAIAMAVPPFVARVALFVDPAPEVVRQVLAACPIEVLQFHGNESAQFCAQFGKPYLKAARVRRGLDLVEFGETYRGASGLLLDAYVADRVGGTGHAFDWSLIPVGLNRPIVLSGGLTIDSVRAAMNAVHCWAVDVSSGIEESPGVKDHTKMKMFAAAVRAAEKAARD